MKEGNEMNNKKYRNWGLIILAVIVIIMIGAMTNQSDDINTPSTETNNELENDIVTDYSTDDIDASLDDVYETVESSLSIGQQNALSAAKSYLDYSAFSYSGLIEQLEFEDYSKEEATYAADNCGADWNEQAALCAQSYLDYSSFSRAGLIEQLEFEGFTSSQAEYGADAVGY
jgi:hypothetical protein